MLIEETPLLVFGISNCKWCKRTDKLLASYHPKKIVIDVRGERIANKTRRALKKISGMKTFPQIFLKSKLLGGFNDTVRKMKTRRIKRQLKSLRMTHRTHQARI